MMDFLIKNWDKILTLIIASKNCCFVFVINSLKFKQFLVQQKTGKMPKAGITFFFKFVCILCVYQQ